MSIVERKDYIEELGRIPYMPRLEYLKEQNELKSYSTITDNEYLKVQAGITYIKKTVTRRHKISLSSVLELSKGGWNAIRDALTKKLARQGFLRADLLATALIEEAHARARALLRKHFSRQHDHLVDKVAKYIIAFALAEEFVEEEEEEYVSV